MIDIITTAVSSHQSDLYAIGGLGLIVGASLLVLRVGFRSVKQGINSGGSFGR